MFNLYRKNSKMRIKYSKNELKLNRFKFFLNHKFFLEERFILNQKYLIFIKFFSYPSKIFNYCLKTGRASATFKLPKLSRHFFKKFCSEGKLSGFRKSSW